MKEDRKIHAPETLKMAMAIHPGEMLRDELEARGLSQRQFAGLIDESISKVGSIIRGKRAIDADTALKIEAATGIKAYIWLRLQSDYDMQKAQSNYTLLSILSKIRTAAAVL